MKRDLKTFLDAVRWPVSQLFLSKVSLKQHDIKIVTPPTAAHAVHRRGDRGEPSARHFLCRRFDLSYIGLLCASGTNPSIRELVVHAAIPEGSPLDFGPDATLSAGLGETVEGIGKTFSLRRDFTGLAIEQYDSTDLPTLHPGRVLYPLRSIGAPVFASKIAETHPDAMTDAGLPLAALSEAEQTAVAAAFEAFQPELNLGLLLDSEDLLHFEYDYDQQSFVPDPFNAGLVER